MIRSNQDPKQTTRQIRLRKIKKRLFVLPRDCGPQTKLEELALDSLDIVELLFVIEDEFGVSIHQDQLRESVLVSDLLDLIEED